MKAAAALVSGLAGAVTITLVHEVVKRIDPKAPRMDLLGMNALSKIMRSSGKTPPDRQSLFLLTMAGDLVANALYYSLTGVTRRKKWLTGTLLGTAAGIGGVLLPKPMGLNPAYSARTNSTKAMTVMLYLIGGVVTSAVLQAMDDK